eukprot:gene1619-3128_t
MESENINDLQIKINSYQEQLQQIEQFLTSDPSSEQYLRLKKDLLQVIQLTKDLIEFQTENSDENQRSAPKNVGIDDQNTDPCRNFNPGDKVEVISGDRPYAAIVMAVNVDGTSCTLKYFEYDEEVVLPLESLSKLPPSELDGAVVKPPGFKCQCKYSADQRWYDVTVDALTEFGYMVTYSQYGVSEEVPLEYLRPMQGKKDKEKVKADTGGLIPIPESLKILPTDTEDERNRKKKRLKAIKTQNRLKSQETEISSTQKTWQTFLVKKSVKRTAVGAIKDSMFASPEQVEGKVGVTRSGLGMTDFERRKRHNFATTLTLLSPRMYHRVTSLDKILFMARSLISLLPSSVKLPMWLMLLPAKGLFLTSLLKLLVQLPKQQTNCKFNNDFRC